jgi:hypothetical protein
MAKYLVNRESWWEFLRKFQKKNHQLLF